jgi:hypothetical protein
MAESDPTRPQAVDPEVQADLVRLLRIRGPLGVLNVADVVVPVVSLGNVVTPDINIRPPAFTSTTVFSTGNQTAPVIGVLLADTGPLGAGTYDVLCLITSGGAASGPTRLINFEHRNSGNTANLMVFSMNMRESNSALGVPTFAYKLSESERLRLIVGSAFGVNEQIVGVLFARSR